jgi:hypothetical protein
MSGEQEDRFDAIDDDADRGELRELLLDSVPGLGDGQRDAMFEHTFEAPVEDDHATDGLIPVDEVFGGTDDDWDASYGMDVADGSDVAGDAVEDVTAPEHDFTDHTDGLLDPHETHETPDDLSDTHEFGMDHGAGHDQPIVGDLPDGDGDWA